MIKEVKLEYKDILGKKDYIYPSLIISDEIILIDCAYPNYYDKIKFDLKEINMDIADIKKIFITHHDYDHIGSLAEFQRKNPDIKVYSSAIEKTYIEKDKKSQRLVQAKEQRKYMPDEKVADYLEHLFENVEKATVDYILKDKDIVDGIEVIESFGHTKGHISFYLAKEKALIAGDLLVIENEKLEIANKELCLDIESTKKSLNKLLDFEIESIYCYHGGLYKVKNLKNEIESLIKTCL